MTKFGRRHGPNESVVFYVEWSSGRRYLVVVPKGGWRPSSITAEEWASGIAGIPVTRGMYR